MGALSTVHLRPTDESHQPCPPFVETETSRDEITILVGVSAVGCG